AHQRSCGRIDTLPPIISNHKRIGGHFEDGGKTRERRDSICMSAQMQSLPNKNLHNSYAEEADELALEVNKGPGTWAMVTRFSSEKMIGMARVSSEVSVSDDEEDKQDFSSYDDSFIDDRINPTAADSQAEAGEVDMIAVYRNGPLRNGPPGSTF
ncbi:hypothetical protein HAX54_016705, partial [Datura stramonium]|nr:hypothetical protein [Datura stramonium]